MALRLDFIKNQIIMKPSTPYHKRKSDDQTLATEIIRLLRRKGYLRLQSGGDRESQDEQIYQYLAERYGLGYLELYTRCVIALDGSAQVIREVTIEAYSEVSAIHSFISLPEEDPNGIPSKISLGILKTFDDKYRLSWLPPERQAGKVSAKISIEPPLKPGETLTYQVLEVNLPKEYYAIQKTQAEVNKREDPVDYWGWQITRPTKKLILEVKFPFGERPLNPTIGIRYALYSGVADKNYPPKALADLEKAKVSINEEEDSIYIEVDYPVFNMIYMLQWNPKVKEVEESINKFVPRGGLKAGYENWPILIVTATKVESRALLDVFSTNATSARRRVAGKTYYLLTTINNTPIYMVQSEKGAATPGGALVTTQNAINNLHPQAVILCGIAFGLRRTKQKMGDILIATQITSYEPSKIDRDQGWIPRGDRVSASDKLIDQFRSGDLDWTGDGTHFGLMVSGEKLVNDPNFIDKLLEIEPEAIGGEMEASGLYVAARNANIDWILVKAICDWGDGNKDDTAQEMAAKNAANFVNHVLQRYL